MQDHTDPCFSLKVSVSQSNSLGPPLGLHAEVICVDSDHLGNQNPNLGKSSEYFSHFMIFGYFALMPTMTQFYSKYWKGLEGQRSSGTQLKYIITGKTNCITYLSKKA